MPTSPISCRFEGCSRPGTGGKRYCDRHFAAWKRGKLPKARYKTCRVESCHKRVVNRGRCGEHFTRDYPGRRPAEAVAATS